MPTLITQSANALSGVAHVPGDKSISHRALMLGCLAIGRTEIEGLLEGEDVLATAAAMRAFGATLVRHGPGRWTVEGVGVGGLLQPETVLDMGNSGTSTRLIIGLAASHAITTVFSGDASLSKRPMKRVIEPLTAMGARFETRYADRLPITVKGCVPALPLTYALPVPSAQVKSALLLAGLNTPGITTVIEKEPTRDHSERMLKGFGAQIWVEETKEGRAISIRGEAELKPAHIIVPGDPSSAAFPIVAATIVPGSDVLVKNVGINPTRSGLFSILQEMGANLEYQNQREVGGEPVADIRVQGSALKAVEPAPEAAATMIDEYPILAIAAAFASGRTIMRGISELRVKESDRIATMAQGLAACGVQVWEEPDGLIVQGTGGAPVAGGAQISTYLDHRIAMSFAVLGQQARAPITIDDSTPIATSFPSFIGLMRELGAELEIGEQA